MLVVLASCVLGALAGCTTAGQPAIAVSPGVSQLDWDNATYSVPMDAYSMTLREVQIVNAAHAASFMHCISWRDTLTADELANVRQWLDYTPSSQRWIFGMWDAAYVAGHASEARGFPAASPPLGAGEVTDVGAAQACVNENQDVMNLEPRSPMYGYVSPRKDAVMNLNGDWMEGFGLTSTDQRYIDLTNQRNACTRQKGYSIVVPQGDKVGHVQIDSGWTSEQDLKARVAEAQCADDMGYTQQVMDIVAAYQIQTIAKHQAELVAIKQVLDARVQDATQILVEHGVM